MFAAYTVREQEVREVGASETLALSGLGANGETAYFSFFEKWNAACQYEVVTRVGGAYEGNARFAVFAMWLLDNPDRADEFISSRLRLIALRREILPTFQTDYLLRHLDNESRFIVLGLYGDKEGAATLSRQHPQIQEFAAANLAGVASDTSGAMVFKLTSHRISENC